MNPNQLFWRRFGLYYKKQWAAVKGLVDWTIMLYILIPFLIFLGINHYLWWQAAPGWSEWIPLPVVLLLFMLVLINGQIFYFYERADILFLNGKTAWTSGLMRRGILAAFTRDLFLAALVILYASPLLIVRYHLTWEAVFFLGFILFFARQLACYLYQFLSFNFYGLWLSLLNWLLKIPICIALLYFFYRFGLSVTLNLLLMGAEAAALAVAIIYRLQVKNKWVHDIDRELLKTDRLQSFIVGQAGIKKPLVPKKHPLVYRKSRRVFRLFNPINGTAEIFLKNRLRDGRWLLFYWQMTIYSVAAIVVFPGPDYLRMLVFIGTTCLFAYWLRNELIPLSDHSFFNLVPLTEETKLSAVKKVYAITAWPGFIIQSAAIGFSLGNWMGILIACVCGFFFEQLVTRIMLNTIYLTKELK